MTGGTAGVVAPKGESKVRDVTRNLCDWFKLGGADLIREPLLHLQPPLGSERLLQWSALERPPEILKRPKS